MSAYMVEDETINRVVSHIYIEIQGSTILGSHYKRLLKDYPLHSDVGYVKLAEDMFKLNIAGVDARYGEGEAKEFRPLDFSYVFTPPESKYQALKSLQCWHYQCCEGDIPETNSLYKIFEGIETCLEHEIIRATPEYDKAVWG